MLSIQKKATAGKPDHVVSQSVNFEQTLTDQSKHGTFLAWLVAGAAIFMSLVLLGGYYYMLPLKERTPFLVMADAATGVATVARLTDDVSIQRITSSEAINRSNVAHFVIARESYDAELLNLRDWNTVLTMSSSDVAAAYTNLYSSLNPDSPYKHYGRERAIRVRILSIVLIGGGNGTPYKGATVRLQRAVYNKQSGGTVPLDNKIATIAFTYKPALKMDEQARLENPLGFQVTSYRVDSDFASPEPAEAPQPAASAPPAEISQIAPAPVAPVAPVASVAEPAPAAPPAAAPTSHPRRRVRHVRLGAQVNP